MVLKVQRLTALTEKTPIKEGRGEREWSLEIDILISNSSTEVSAFTPEPVL